MPDERRHRGPDHSDRALFSGQRVEALRRSVEDLSLLLGRGYAEPSSLKIVGDRYQLRRRQREAVRRASCSDSARSNRLGRLVGIRSATGGIAVDGFNVLITIEAALSGGVLLGCRDGCLRDIASIHGSYRQVEETRAAVEAVGAVLAGVAPVRWYLDSPVSNSGRLARLLRTMAEQRGWPWTVALVKNTDREIVECGDVVATSDSNVLDTCGSWINLARTVVESLVADAWIVVFSDSYSDLV